MMYEDMEPVVKVLKPGEDPYIACNKERTGGLSIGISSFGKFISECVPSSSDVKVAIDNNKFEAEILEKLLAIALVKESRNKPESPK